MKKKIFAMIFTFLGIAVLIGVLTNNKKPLTVLGAEGIYLEKSIDDKIKEAELIVIGEVVTNLPSRWNGPNGRNDPKNISPEEISRAHGLFTDSLVSINQILKGEFADPIVRVRSFIGETESVHWINESQPIFVKKHTYLLFLEKDDGATARVDPGNYISVNANMAVYEIVNGKAISADDEWILEDLIAYIQNLLQNSE